MTLKREDFDFTLTKDTLVSVLHYFNVTIGQHNVTLVFPTFQLGTRLKCTGQSFHSFEYLAELEEESISGKGIQTCFINIFNTNKNSKMRIFKMLVDSRNMVYIYFERNDR